jgi:hypothetical protein
MFLSLSLVNHHPEQFGLLFFICLHYFFELMSQLHAGIHLPQYRMHKKQDHQRTGDSDYRYLTVAQWRMMLCGSDVLKYPGRAYRSSLFAAIESAAVTDNGQETTARKFAQIMMAMLTENTFGIFNSA